MKTENTPANKKKFFGLYMGQEINTYRLTYSTKRLQSVALSGNGNALGYLELKPLSQISDEDMKSISRILDFHDGNGLIIERVSRGSQRTVEIRAYDRYNDYPNSINTLKLFTDDVEFFSIDETGGVFDYDCNRILNVMDYLRSKGYAVPWMDLSVDDLVEYGWITLK